MKFKLGFILILLVLSLTLVESRKKKSEKKAKKDFQDTANELLQSVTKNQDIKPEDNSNTQELNVEQIKEKPKKERSESVGRGGGGSNKKKTTKKDIEDAKMMEEEVDSAASMAESLVKATESAFESAGFGGNNFFEGIVDVIEQVKKREDEYFEEIQHQQIDDLYNDEDDEEEEEGVNLVQTNSQQQGRQFPGQNMMGGGMPFMPPLPPLIPPPSMFGGDEQGHVEEVMVIDFFDENGNEHIIEMVGEPSDIEQMIEDDKEFFEEDRLIGEEILNRLEEKIKFIDEELRELEDFEEQNDLLIDPIELMQIENEILMGLETESEEEELELYIYDEDEFEEAELDRKNIKNDVVSKIMGNTLGPQVSQKENSQKKSGQQAAVNEDFDGNLDYLDQIKGLDSDSYDKLKKIEDDENKLKEESLKQIEVLLEEGKTRVFGDRMFGFLTLATSMLIIFVCFFKNFAKKSEKEEQEYQKYDKYSYLDQPSSLNNNNNDDVINNTQKLLDENYDIPRDIESNNNNNSTKLDMVEDEDENGEELRTINQDQEDQQIREEELV